MKRWLRQIWSRCAWLLWSAFMLYVFFRLSDSPLRLFRDAPAVGVFILLGFLIVYLPLLYLLYRYCTRERRRARLGLCAACGYDLTGNLSGTCPKCGAAVAASV